MYLVETYILLGGFPSVQTLLPEYGISYCINDARIVVRSAEHWEVYCKTSYNLTVFISNVKGWDSLILCMIKRLLKISLLWKDRA